MTFQEFALRGIVHDNVVILPDFVAVSVVTLVVVVDRARTTSVVLGPAWWVRRGKITLLMIVRISANALPSASWTREPKRTTSRRVE